MNGQELAVRLRARAARSPALRRALGKAPLAPAVPSSPHTVRELHLETVSAAYEGNFPLAAVSYGTVRDFTDSLERMPGLAGANFDMKDLQRCWMLKAILGNVPAGSRLVEIGAGEPLVAGALAELGYDVTVVDPYDGSGNGPREYQQFRDAYPQLNFIREQFPPREALAPGLGAVYSISVLEHVPLEALDGVIAAGQELLGEGGCQIHAVDHVLAGWGAEEHLEKLRRIAAGMGIPDADLQAAIDRLRDDPETYFVSAEAHNRWRGDLPYDQYEMRRIVSVDLFARRA